MRKLVIASALVLALGGLGVTGCKRHRGGRMTSKPGVASTGSANEEFRKSKPHEGAAKPWSPPAIVETKLANGIRVLLVERHDLPIVSFQVVLDRGADQAAPGEAAFLSAMLLQGTKTKSALEVSDAFSRLGAQYSFVNGYDNVGLSVKVLAANFADAVALAADCTRNPAFAKDEVERERARRLTSIAQQKDSPSTLMRNAVGEALYPLGHPYHAPVIGYEAEVKKVTPERLAALHKTMFQPGGLAIVVAGDVNQATLTTELGKAFGDWQVAEAPMQSPSEAPDVAPKKRIVLVDRPGAQQSQVAATLVGVARSNEDYHAVMVLNAVLGGLFSSRLNLNLREKHAYTYGAWTTFAMRHGAGPFFASAAIKTDKTGPGAAEILAEIQRITEAPITDDELADAKTFLVRQLPATFETASGVADSLAHLVIYHLPLDTYERRPEHYRAVTKDDVLRVAKKYLRLDRLQLVVVGDAAVVAKDLGQLGLGEVELRK